MATALQRTLRLRILIIIILQTCFHVDSEKIVREQSSTIGFLKSVWTEETRNRWSLSLTSSITPNQTNSNCTEDLTVYQSALAVGSPWAVQMRDAGGRWNAHRVGLVSECEGVEPPFNYSFKTKYCTAVLQSPLLYTLRSVSGPFVLTSQSIGLCVPDICDTASIQELVYTELLQNNLSTKFSTGEVLCVNSDRSFGVAAISLIAVLSVWLFLLVVATIVDCLYLEKLPEGQHIFQHPPQSNPQAQHKRLSVQPSQDEASERLPLSLHPDVLQPNHSAQNQASLTTSSPSSHPLQAPVLPRPETGTAKVFSDSVDHSVSMTTDVESSMDWSMENITFFSMAEAEEEYLSCGSESQQGLRRPFTLSCSTSIEWSCLDSGDQSPAPSSQECISQLAKRGNNALVILLHLVKCLSLYTSLQTLWAPQQTMPQLACLHGVRVFACVWIIVFHTYLFLIPFGDNLLDFTKDMNNKLSFTMIVNGSYGIETLFILSGVLTGYLTSRNFQGNNRKANWVLFIFRHYLRLMPTMLVVIVIYVILFPYMTHGPLQSDQAMDHQECMKYGWLNLLLLQNYASVGCLPWTWYIAVDWQLFILTPFILILLNKRAKMGYVIGFHLVLASCLTCGLVSGLNDLPVNPNVLSLNQTVIEKYTNLYYKRPYTHAGSFLVALLFGFYLQSTEFVERPSKIVVVTGSTVAAAVAGAVVLGIKAFLGEVTVPSTTEAALYNAVGRTGWSLAVCWLIYICMTNRSGPVNKLLSWSGWVPLSRLGYSLYLTHPIVVLCYVTSLDQLPYLSGHVNLTVYLGVAFISFITAAFVFLIFENPFSAVQFYFTKCPNKQ